MRKDRDRMQPKPSQSHHVAEPALERLASFKLETNSHRAHYQDTIEGFLQQSADSICGALANRSAFTVERLQFQAWRVQVELLQPLLLPYSYRGHLFFEFVLPRIGRRIDVVLVIEHIVFVLEFKVGESEFQRHAVDQVWDYALDLKNFHEPSHRVQIAPVLIATRAEAGEVEFEPPAADGVFVPLKIAPQQLGSCIETILSSTNGSPVDGSAWGLGRYSPTPTIIEAARALYRGHAVSEISRSDAGAFNLTRTSKYASAVIADAQRKGQKVLCLLTGVPGAGKTLVGLDIATQHMNAGSELYSVFLSGNGPLVAILREALARDSVERERQSGRSMSKSAARRQIESFIQNVHHFRDDCLIDAGPPPEHVAIFDEAQRAWNREQTNAFMARKKGVPRRFVWKATVLSLAVVPVRPGFAGGSRLAAGHPKGLALMRLRTLRKLAKGLTGQAFLAGNPDGRGRLAPSRRREGRGDGWAAGRQLCGWHVPHKTAWSQKGTP